MNESSGSLRGASSDGLYWLSTAYQTDADAYDLHFGEATISSSYYPSRWSGFAVQLQTPRFKNPKTIQKQSKKQKQFFKTKKTNQKINSRQFPSKSLFKVQFRIPEIPSHPKSRPDRRTRPASAAFSPSLSRSPAHRAPAPRSPSHDMPRRFYYHPPPASIRKASLSSANLPTSEPRWFYRPPTQSSYNLHIVHFRRLSEHRSADPPCESTHQNSRHFISPPGTRIK